MARIKRGEKVVRQGMAGKMWNKRRREMMGRWRQMD